MLEKEEILYILVELNLQYFKCECTKQYQEIHYTFVS